MVLCLRAWDGLREWQDGDCDKDALDTLQRRWQHEGCRIRVSRRVVYYRENVICGSEEVVKVPDGAGGGLGVERAVSPLLGRGVHGGAARNHGACDPL